jgi:adenylate cyclase
MYLETKSVRNSSSAGHALSAQSREVVGGSTMLSQGVYAQALRGLSHIVAGRLTSAIEDLSDALSFARFRKAGLENEPRILADLANAYRLNGDTETAFAIVDEAIQVATERHARVPECLARIVRAGCCCDLRLAIRKPKEGRS